jgi:uncharacterized membrane protein
MIPAAATLTEQLWAFLVGGTPGAAGHLEWSSPTWVVVVASAAALLAWGVAWFGERPLLSRLAEAALFGLALAGMVIAIAKPVWVEEEGRQEPARLAVVVDASRSMSILEDGKPRSEAADAILSRIDASDVDVYHFGPDLAVGKPGAYDLPGTDLEGALGALAERHAGEKLAGVVLITDGIDRGFLRERFLEEEKPAGPPELPGPLTVYQVGTPGDIHDLAVRNLDAGGYGFVRSPFTITAHLDGLGYEGSRVSVQLSRDGSPVTTQTVTLGKDGKAEAVFNVTPDVPGRFTYSVSVPVYEDDAVPANNTMPVVVRVVRDRVRVLQVAGAPSWDVKFLRRFLKHDPSVDLVSFFILRTDEDFFAGYDDRELSLIPFPHERLFTEELDTFDLVIFQNFDYQPYFNQRGGPAAGPVLLKNLRDFVVEDGHAFAMIGGSKSFDLGKYAGTPLAEVVPLKMGLSGDRSDRVCSGLCDATPFTPKLTEEGRRHPITRLAAEAADNELWWERLHPADGTNLTLGKAAGAEVLLEHPGRDAPDGEPLPILAVQEVGKGRAMAMTIDSSWRWSFDEAAEGRGNQAYLRFWKNAFRWLVADPTASRVTVETPRENYAMGDVVRVVVRARDPGFAPLAGAKVAAVVEGGGAKTPIEGWTGPDGEIALEWVADRRGPQRVTAEVSTKEGEAVGESDTVFAVTTRDPELDEVVPDGAFLQWLASSTNGRFYGPGEAGMPLRDPGAGRTVWDRRETALWRAPGLALWVVALAGMAWIVRRRAGLR